MKVVQNTSEHLVIADRPWVFGVLISATILFVVYNGMKMSSEGDPWGSTVAIGGGLFGLVFFAAFVRRTQAIFDRSRGVFVLRSRTVFRYREQTWMLSEVERAIIETSSDSDGDTHRTTILTRGADARRVPLTPVYASGIGAERIRDAINAWLGALDSEARRT